MNYFAGANSRYGFKSVFESVFSECRRLFIIKGSSGCGKSTLMQKMAKRAEALGYGVDYIYCSADSLSLDGIIIPALGVAVADGTAPHIMDVKYPCVRESIINLGQFWNEKLLLPRGDEIIGLTNLKACHYKNAYKALSAAGNIAELLIEINGKCIKQKKLDSFVFKLYEKLKGQKGVIKHCFATAFTYNGLEDVCVFDNLSALYTVNGGCGLQLVTAVAQLSRELGDEAVIFCHPVNTELAQAVYFPKTKTALSVSGLKLCKKATESHNISCQRFYEKQELALVKNRISGLTSLYESLAAEAQSELFEARKTHNEIEEIYIKAMDFESLNLYSEKLINQILG
ncbi:MAG: hypothetical protein IKZ23_01325 [Clostridia bacterium]|nr:hypothetical protein [Clostridia bacterium]